MSRVGLALATLTLGALVPTAPQVATAATANPYHTTPAPTQKLKGWRQTMHQNFTAPSKRGTFESVYRNSWCGYREGGTYNNSRVMYTHDGVLDLTLDGRLGAGGAFGPPSTCGGQRYGRFSMRARAVGAADNGVAVMVWPSSNVWGDGEIDFPEGEFDAQPFLYQHPLNCTNCSHAYAKSAGAQWYPWHVYTVEWTPKAVRTYVDGRRVKTLTHDIPRTKHRYTLQIGPAGPHPKPGKMLVDWVAEWTYAP